MDLNFVPLTKHVFHVIVCSHSQPGTSTADGARAGRSAGGKLTKQSDALRDALDKEIGENAVKQEETDETDWNVHRTGAIVGASVFNRIWGYYLR